MRHKRFDTSNSMPRRHDLDELTPAQNASGTVDDSFAYDLAGNLTSKTGVGTYTYPAQGATAIRPHAPTAAGSFTFSYDANGNMNSGAGRTYVWDGENRPTNTTSGGVTSNYVYGPDGARLKKTTLAVPRNCTSVPSPLPTEMTHYVFGDERIS
jgi:hypothetical protein